ncbi:MAG: hypothetical protein ACKVY0_09735 [Prosthecobacter sp.]|uniref:hypothetical protein n=1 Tax=Prosthecobacter sp. TaxID=1965333 RepID=UPI0038FFC976
MNPEKKLSQARPISATAPKAIRLKPSTTDYATFAATTAKALGMTAPTVPRTKPNKRVLSLMNLES